MALEELDIGYKTPLFQSITAKINRGLLVGLFGRNGIGKSTLLHTLAGLQPPIGGKVMLLNRERAKWTLAEVAKHLAFVPSHPLRTPRLRVADMVGIGRYGFTNWIGAHREIDKESIHKALEATSLSHLAYRDSATLSDGEWQRASIARSLAQDTPLILLDEPTAFLDMGNKYKVIYLLKELTQKAQKGILFSTHDLTLALQVCDLLWIMTDDGFHADTPAQLIQEGVFDTLFSSDGLVFDRQTLGYHYAPIIFRIAAAKRRTPSSARSSDM